MRRAPASVAPEVAVLRPLLALLLGLAAAAALHLWGPVVGPLHLTLPAARVPVDRGVFRLRAREPGIYRVRALDGPNAGAEVLLAVNQASAAASDLHDRLAALDLPPAARAGEPGAPLPVGEGPLWTLILLAVVALVTLEWATYHRRVTV